MTLNNIASEIAMREPVERETLIPLPRTASDILKARGTAKAPTSTIELAEQIIGTVESPDKMQALLNGVGDGLDDYAPEAAEQLRNATSRAMFFLAGKAPKKTPAAPGFEPTPPKKDELQRFERYLRAVNDPSSILDDAYSGTLVPEAIEAVKHVYPETYLTMQSDIASIINHAPNMSYTRRMQLSALLGQDMTGTLKPAVALGAQNAYASAAQSNSPSKQMPVSRAQGLNMADRAEYNTAARQEAQRGVGMWNKRG